MQEVLSSVSSRTHTHIFSLSLSYAYMHTHVCAHEHTHIHTETYIKLVGNKGFGGRGKKQEKGMGDVCENYQVHYRYV